MVTGLLYALVSLCLAVYSLQSLYLLWLYHRHKHKPAAISPPSNWPLVTVQLPLYNEIGMVERLLAAVIALDFPRSRLQIQLLDDSSDETPLVAARLVSEIRAAGWDITHIRRAHRNGFKAGALANGMEFAWGEFIAIFDADFLPPPDFLKRGLGGFSEVKIGCVQGRWGHLNRDFSLLTRLQAMAIDAHFIVEQTARSNGNLFMNFNGSAGIWRSACIIDSGGWQSGTLTEDFDLSYRAQLKGWRIAYLPDLVSPAELPVQMAAFKQQQARWAQGSLQTARKLLRPIWKASNVPLRQKLLGTLHLTHYLVHPLLLLALVLSLIIRLEETAFLPWLPLLMVTAVISPLLYLTSAAPEAPAWLKRLRLVPALVLLSIGISLNNARAAMAGLFGQGEGTFFRTPKFALRTVGQHWESHRYVLHGFEWSAGELAMMIVSLAGLYKAVQNADLAIIPWLILYGAGYGLVAFLALTQSIRLERLKRQVGRH